MVTMHPLPDRQTSIQTDKHHGNSATIRCNETHRALKSHNYRTRRGINNIWSGRTFRASTFWHQNAIRSYLSPGAAKL